MEVSNEMRARIFASYFYNDIWCDYSSIHGPNFKKHKLVGLAPMFGTIYCLLDDIGNEGLPIENCQLILTPLTQITDEDAIEVLKMMVHPGREYPRTDYVVMDNEYGNKNVTLNNDWYSQRVVIGKRGTVWCNTQESIKTPPAVYDFLRSRSYDLGFGEIPSLIDAGIATTSNTK